MAKVMQCWDDGVVNDIRLIELLRKYNAKATFNLNPGLHNDERLEARWGEPGYSGWSCKGYISGKIGKHELVEIYNGFNVASHCWRHETAGIAPDDQFIKAAIDARKFLEDLFQRPCPGFAWPCGSYTEKLADALQTEGFTYGRTTENSLHVGKGTHPLILHPSCHFQHYDFYEKYEKAKCDNEIFYFWGHSYEMLDSEGMWNQLEMKLKFLHDDPDAVWYNLDEINWLELSQEQPIHATTQR
ncbi:MAG: polysaccharide deacetylase family protein [Victivallaceae bacterium]|nr:polysaccharide deacetylase family protein [Victivallaceae bacterium]